MKIPQYNNPYFKEKKMETKNALHHIKKVIEYLYHDEHKHYESSSKQDQESHIFKSVRYLDIYFDNVEDIRFIAYAALKKPKDKNEKR